MLIVGIFIILVLIVLFLLTVPPGENILKGVLESQLSEALGQNIIITSLETNLLTRLKISGLYILGNDKDPPTYVVNLADLNIHYSLTGLLNKKISVKSIEINKIDVNIERDSLGHYNLAVLNSTDSTATAQTEESTYKLVLGSLAIDTMNTTYVDELIGLNTSAKNIGVNVVYSNVNGYAYHVDIDEIKSIYGNIPLLTEKFTLSGSISNEFLAIDNFSADFNGIDLTGSAQAVFGTDTTITAAIRLEGNPELFLDTVLSIYSMPEIKFNKGISFWADISGNLNSPLLFANLSVPEVQSDFGKLENFLLKLSYTDGLVTLESLNANIFNGAINANGLIKIDGVSGGSADINVVNVDMAQAWQTIYKEKSPYEGQVDGKISFVAPGGNIADWQINSDLEARRARYLGKNLPDFYINANLNNGIGKFKIHHPDFEIELNSAIEDSKISGDYTINILSVKPLAEIFGIEEIDGKINAAGKLSGTLEYPEIDAHIYAENVNYRNLPLDKLEADISYKNDLLSISRMNFSGRLDSIDQSRPPFDIDSISGGLIYSGKAEGSLDNIKAGLDIELNNPRFSDWGIDHGKLYISANGKNIYIDNSSFEKNAHIVKINGRFNIDDRKGNLNLSFFGDTTGTDETGNLNSDFQIKENDIIRLNAHGREIDIDHLRALYSDTLIVDGILNFDLAVEGELNNPTAELKIRAANPMFNDIYVDSVMADITVFNKELSMRVFQLYKGEHILKSSGILVLERDSLGHLTVTDNCDIKGKLYYNDWDMAILNPFLKERAKISGISSLNIDVKGTLGAPQITGTLEIDKSKIILLPEADSITNLSLQIAVDDSIFTFKRFSGMVNNIPIEVSGNVSMSNGENYYSDLLFNIPGVGFMSAKGSYASENIDLKLKIDNLDLSLLEPFAPTVKKLEGELNSEILITGAVDDPSITGNFVINKFSFQPKILPSLFTDGVIRIKFDKRKITLDSLFLKLDNGSLLASGFLNHENGEIVDMDFNMTIIDLKINEPKEYEIHAQSGTLRYWGKNKNFLLDGDIQLGETKLLTRIKAQSILPWARSVEKVQPELPSFLAQTKINVRIRESDKLWIDNNLAHIRLHSELGFIGSPIQPNVTGRLSVDEGYVLYLDRKFKVKQGIIFFNDPFRFNPEINIIAEAMVKSYQALESQAYIIKIEISGDLDELTTNIYSEPPLDKSDILALLTLGGTRSQLSGKDTESGDISTKAILLERASMLSSQRISGYVSQRVGTFLGLDQVSVEGNLFKFDKSWGPQLLASKKISDRMSLTYKTTVGHMNDQSFKLNYLLNRRFSLEGQTDRQGRSGLDLIYGLRFK